MKISFSVVVPVHNKKRHIISSVESIFSQSLQPFEIIIVDDASDDGSAEIISELEGDNIVRLKRDKPGPGGYAARNLAIKHARGDWIAFLDADDLWLPKHLEDLALLADSHPDADCLATRYEHVFADHVRPSALTAALAEAEQASVDFDGFLDIWAGLRECPIWTGASAFRRTRLIDAGLFPEGRALRGGDKDLWLRAAAGARFAYCSRVSARFNHDSDNKVTRNTTTATVPIVVETARALMVDAPPAKARRLRRLVNQQIGLYARFCFKERHIPVSLAENLYMPEGLGTRLAIHAMRLVPAAWRQSAYRLIKLV